MTTEHKHSGCEVVDLKLDMVSKLRSITLLPEDKPVIKRQLYSELVLSEATSFIFQHHWQRINVALPSDVPSLLPSDVQVYHQRLSRAFDLLSIFLCSLIQTLTPNPTS